MPRILNSIAVRALLFLSCSIAIYFFTTPYMTAASIAYFLFLIGIFFCASRKIHSYFMYAGITIDLSLLIFLELTRSAIAEAVSAPLSLCQRGHILCSLIAVLLYIPAVILGNKKLKTSQRNLHKQMGITAFAFRSIGFLLMFSLLAKVQSKL